MAFTQLPYHPLTSEIGAQTILSPAFDVGGMTELDVAVQLNSIKSGATFSVSIEHSMDMKDWYDLGTVITGVTNMTDDSRVKNFTDFMRYTRAVTTIAGTDPYMTWSTLGIAKDGV